MATPQLTRSFLAGYGLVSRQQRQQKQDERTAEALKLERERYQNTVDWRRSEDAEDDAYRQSQAALGQERWNKSFAADQSYRDAQMGLSRGRLAVSQANASAARTQNELEWLKQRRKVNEQHRKRTLTGAFYALKNGNTAQAVDLMQRADVPVEKLIDPKFEHAQSVLTGWLGGAPVKPSALVSAGGVLLQDKINNVVGQPTKDGGTIVKAELASADMMDNGEVALGLTVWAKGKDGKIHQYEAPITSNRSPEDEYVLTVPVDGLLGYVKGLDLLSKAIDKDQLRGVIQQNRIANGWAPDEYQRGPGNTLYQPETGNVKVVHNTGEEAKAATDALEYAQSAVETAFPFGIAGAEPAKVERVRKRAREEYMRAVQTVTPVPSPTPDLVRHLQESGPFVATEGKYAGKQIILMDDGTVVAR